MLPNDMRDADERARSRGCWFDVAAAERVRHFFRSVPAALARAQWAGKPFELLDWQWERVVLPPVRLEAARRHAAVPAGVRRRSPRRTGRARSAPGIALYLLTKDGEPGAEVYSAAATATRRRHRLQRGGQHGARQSP
jgi:hypothetical protein